MVNQVAYKEHAADRREIPVTNTTAGKIDADRMIVCEL